MKKLIATSLIAASMIAASAPAHAQVTLGQDGNDLLIVNNGDGSDFFSAISRINWLSWLRIG
ncbi:MAG: hypothetical protein P8J20_01850 [Novosphingobium sp.]|nr:hypothetical protein [Novosphingobium sp.]